MSCIEEIGEQDFKTVFGKNITLKTMLDLKNKYKDVSFFSSSIKTEQCKQFFRDFKKTLKKCLGTEYNMKLDLGHFEVYGFVEKNNKYVYFNISDLRENGAEFENVLYRSANGFDDFTGGSNRFTELENLDFEIKKLLM